MGETTGRARIGLTVAFIAALLCAGCDKCGHPIKFNAPSIQKACGDGGESAR